MNKKIFKSLILILVVCLCALSFACVQQDADENKNQGYIISAEYFETTSFEIATKSGFENQTGTQPETKQVLIYFTCELDLTGYSISCNLLDSSGKILYSFEDDVTANVKGGGKSVHKRDIPTDISGKVDQVVAVFTGYATELPTDTIDDLVENTFEVTFHFNNDNEDRIVKVVGGECVVPTLNPQKENSVFVGWYDVTLQNEYDFSKKITKDLDLYAKYTLDYESLTNKITREIMPAVITVQNKSVNATGSGVVIAEDANNYYALTNNHVVYTTSIFPSYSVVDYRGRSYVADVLVRDANYDLAIVGFAKIDVDADSLVDDTCIALPFSVRNFVEGSNVVALGQPLGQKNAITYGEITKYSTPVYQNCDRAESAVDANSNYPLEGAKPISKVITHSAHINRGNSGGALIDVDCKIVGINYAGTLNAQTEEWSSSFAIPVESVLQFINKYSTQLYGMLTIIY